MICLVAVWYRQRVKASREGLRWKVHLARRRPKVTAGVVVIILVAAVFARWTLQAAAYFWLTLLFAGLGLMDFFLPVTYELTPEGAREICLFPRKFIRWQDVKRVLADAEGIKLSPFATETRLEAFRGIYLRFEDNQDEVEAAVRRFWRGRQEDE